MKNTLINLVAKLAGVGKALEFLDGKKSYIAGGGLILAGASMVLLDLVPVLAAKDAASILAFLTSAPSHPGVQKVLEGVGILGLRHAVAKAAAPAETPAPEPESKQP